MLGHSLLWSPSIGGAEQCCLFELASESPPLPLLLPLSSTRCGPGDTCVEARGVAFDLEGEALAVSGIRRNLARAHLVQAFPLGSMRSGEPMDVSQGTLYPPNIFY